MPYGHRPGEWALRQQAQDGDEGGDGGGTDLDPEEARETLLAELAKHSAFTVDDLREKDDEFLRSLIETLDLDVEDLVEVMDAQIAMLECRTEKVLGTRTRDSDPEPEARLDGYFAKQEASDRDDDADRSQNEGVEVSSDGVSLDGYFTNGGRAGDD